jgi:hypothetical protein
LKQLSITPQTLPLSNDFLLATWLDGEDAALISGEQVIDKVADD